MLKFASLLIAIACSIVVQTVEFDETYIFRSKTLPEDLNYMPQLGNGHVAFTTLSRTVNMNGLYNGYRGESHRARIPNWANIRLEYCENAIDECVYEMNIADGVFSVTLDTDDVTVRHSLIVHRLFNRAIVNFVTLTRKNSTAELSFKLRQEPGAVNPEDLSRDSNKVGDAEDDIDIKFNATQSISVRNHPVLATCGNTYEVEDPVYQTEVRRICVMRNRVPEEITLKVDEQSKSYKFIMTVDEDYETAEAEMANAILLDDDVLLDSHRNAWNEFWDDFNVQITEDKELASVVHASIFYLANSLPSLRSRQPAEQFYGLSPSGIGRGGLLKDYQGHNFWDTETWMFPAINVVNAEWARQLLSYRFNSLRAAMDNAKNTSYEGARFAWESAYTGREVTPDCCPEVVEYEIHITADISFAQRLYFSVTNDYDYMKREGCQLSKQIAKFWASRVSFNETTRYYELNNVMGPDEDHEDVDNNGFTNVVAGYALYFGQFTECLCEKLIFGYQKDKDVEKWGEIAEHLKLLYDEELDYHPQYEEYARGTMIKQADIVLMGYPLEYPMNKSTQLNDLKYYEPVTRENGPAMTWGMHAIGYLDMEEYDEADRLLKKSYSGYQRTPFYVWSEVIPGTQGAINFITGAGGFLQVILSGYGGVRPKLGYLQLRRPRPLPLPSDGFMRIEGLYYLGSTYRIYVNLFESSVAFTALNADQPLKFVFPDGTERPVEIDDSIAIGDEGVRVMPVTNNLFDCPIPTDRIGERLP